MDSKNFKIYFIHTKLILKKNGYQNKLFITISKTSYMIKDTEQIQSIDDLIKNAFQNLIIKKKLTICTFLKHIRPFDDYFLSNYLFLKNLFQPIKFTSDKFQNRSILIDNEEFFQNYFCNYFFEYQYNHTMVFHRVYMNNVSTLYYAFSLDNWFRNINLIAYFAGDFFQNLQNFNNVLPSSIEIPEKENIKNYFISTFNNLGIRIETCFPLYLSP